MIATASSNPGSSQTDQRIGIGRVAAVCVGNALEFYDFLAYTLFAVYIGHAFFPTHSGALSLLLSVATFGIGFVTRPLGAWVLGRLGDRAGRRPAMLLSFLLMGGGMLLLAITPSYARIGIAAPVLAVFSRLVQGFALGADVGPTTAYLVEAAAPSRRGLYGSLQLATQQAANLTAALVGLGLTRVLSPAALPVWGWRIAFLLGVLIVPFGLLLLYRLPETLPDRAPPGATGSPTATRLRPHLPVIICVLWLLASGTIGTYVLNYLTTYALTTLHMITTRAFGMSVIAALCQVIGHPLSGWLSDRLGRRPVMRGGFIGMLMLVMPAFVLIGHHPAAPLLYVTVGTLALCFTLTSAPVLVALTEALPASVRSGVVALTYAFAIAIFGGSTQLVLTWLIQRSGSALAPAWYWMAALLLGLIAALCIPETSPRARSAAAPHSALN